jgi:hypothetical protein
MLVRIGNIRILWPALALLLVVAGTAGGIVCIATRPQPEPAGDAGIPFERSLAAMGLIATPTTQLPGPVTVDRVVVDGEHTYIAYHMKQAWHATSQGIAYFTITAVPGGWLNTGSSWSCEPPKNPLPDWFPWHPDVALNCVMQYGSVAPNTRAVSLQVSYQSMLARPGFSPPMRPLGTIRVPLDLRALRLRLSVEVRGLASHAGVRVGLSHLYLWPIGGYLEGRVTGPFNSVPVAPHAYVNGVEIQSIGAGDCSNNSCPQTWILPPEPHGGRLTLTIPQVLLEDLGRLAHVSGPWQIRFVVP